ncbi:MAG: helix-turn-helix domain-containing protein [Alphaproteobacteria bacterium]
MNKKKTDATPEPPEAAVPEDTDDAARRDASRLYHREYNRRRFAEDPEFRERKNRNNRDYYRRRWEADPEFRDRKREANRRSQERRQATRQGEPKLGRRRGPTDIDRHVGERVRTRRRALRIALDEIADLLGVKRRQVALYERGETTLTSSQLHALSVRFGVRIDWFFAELDDAAAAVPDVEPGLPRTAEAEEVARAFADIQDEVSRLRLLSLVQSLSANPP